MQLLDSLNPAQREAVTAGDGPLLVLAGAGSGKTRVIAYRIAYLVVQLGIPPRNILAVTFTNKAAEEMRERVGRLLKGEALQSAPLISTFHSLCVRILRYDISALDQGYTRSFTIYDQDDAVRLVKSCIRDLGLDEKRFGPRTVVGRISTAKNRGEDAESYAAASGYVTEERAAVARVFDEYVKRLQKNNALDFDDLLIKTVQLLKRSSEIREKYNRFFTHIMVDEYQDTNALQFSLIRLLTEKQQNIFVVGDEDQSIYKWRGADISNILNFERHYTEARVIRLEQNYRSTQNILDVASAVVKHNIERKGKNLWTANPTGERIKYFMASDAEEEARFVGSKIEEHLRFDSTARMAVLYRTNAQSRLFEETMRRIGTSYNIVGGFSFYERAEVRDIVAYLKLALNPQDSIALLRVINSPPRGIGKQTIEEIERHAAEKSISHWNAITEIIESRSRLGARAISALKNFQQVINQLAEMALTAGGDSPISEVVKAAILDTGYSNALKAENTEQAEGRLENLQELVNAAAEYDRQEFTLRNFIDHAALVSDTDEYRRDAPVTLMTMHSAKGLEFPVVFIAGLEDGLFPHARSTSDPAELEEERRLCYVAITRAERHLYVSHAMKRRVYGEEIASEPSRFLNEMPIDLMQDLSEHRSWLSFARSSSTLENKYAARALRGDTAGRTAYKAKTYNSVESIAEFFRQRDQQLGLSSKTKAQAPRNRQGSTEPSTELKPGMEVIHSKYGRGLVLRREGNGDNTKLTVSFPGYGQKKLVEKYAKLVRA